MQNSQLTITPGKPYRTRDGHKARIYALDHPGDYPLAGTVLYSDGWDFRCWSRCGRTCRPVESDDDLIAEWTDPEPIPWTHGDVRPGMWLKGEGRVGVHAVVAIELAGVHIGASLGFRTWEELAKNWLNSTDLREWKPCTKEAQS